MSILAKINNKFRCEFLIMGFQNFTSVKRRTMAGFNKDYKPGVYPKNKTEIDNAAVKYNMVPELYKPFADDGLGYGDYPDLPIGLGDESKDPYYPYDYPELLRNYHEPLKANHDLYDQTRCTQADTPRYTVFYAIKCWLAAMLSSFAIYYWGDDKRMFRPVVPKQYPQKNTYYEFEEIASEPEVKSKKK